MHRLMGVKYLLIVRNNPMVRTLNYYPICAKNLVSSFYFIFDICKYRYREKKRLVHANQYTILTEKAMLSLTEVLWVKFEVSKYSVRKMF